MDIPQLKLLAGLVRGLLEQHNVPIGHSQSLDCKTSGVLASCSKTTGAGFGPVAPNRRF